MSRRTQPPLRLSAWMRAHYDELRPEQPFDAKWVGERVRELGITDRDGKHPSRSALTMAWSREQKRRRAQADPPANRIAAGLTEALAVARGEAKPAALHVRPAPPQPRPFAVVNPVRIETAPVTTDKPAMKPTKF